VAPNVVGSNPISHPNDFSEPFLANHLIPPILSKDPMISVLCQGLLVDMDGVLVDSTPAVARVWTRWALKHNMDPEYAVQFSHGRTSLASIQELLPHANSAVHREEDRWMERSEIADVADVVALPGANELLTAVPRAQLAVVTSATRPLAEVRLRAAGLWQHVAQLITASDIQRGKPDPEPYLKGAAAIHLSPQNCVVIEDAPSGTRSGKSAGARVLAIRTTTADESLLAAGADWIANDCSSLRLPPHPSPGKLLLEILDATNSRTPKIR
jgi:sugar-phosphatase